MNETSLDGFTEKAYASLIRQAKTHYTFTSFEEHHLEGDRLIMRHDIDFSPQRARALAAIEKAEGVQSTWFIYLHSRFYNALELENIEMFRDIVSMGHRIGLHFDPVFYRGEEGDFLEERMQREREVICRVLDVEIYAVSWHNPVHGNCMNMNKDEYQGLINAYGKTLSSSYKYISDSNGYWRYENLHEVIESRSFPRLQVLIHPLWWTKEPMPPREKVMRSIYGRADRRQKLYDQEMETMGRRNVR